MDGYSHATLLVTRGPLAPPLTRGARSARLDITTTATGDGPHYVPLDFVVAGSVLGVSPESFDFGFVPQGQTRTAGLTVTNSGDDTLVTTVTGPPYSSSTATVPGASSGTIRVTYSPQPGTAAAGVTLTAGDLCTDDLFVNLYSGDGPYAQITSSIGGNCFDIRGAIQVTNLGTQGLELTSCSITDWGIDLGGTPVSLAPGDPPASLNIYPPGGPAGTEVVNLSCDTNEPTSPTTFPLSITRYGANLVLEYTDDLVFSCAGTPASTTEYFKITNTGNELVSFYCYGGDEFGNYMDLPGPLYTSCNATLDPRESTPSSGSGAGEVHFASGCSETGSGYVWLSSFDGTICDMNPLLIELRP